MITPNEIIKQEELTSNPWILFEQLLKERDQALSQLKAAEEKAGVFRYVAIQNYNAPESLSDATICSLVDAEAQRIIEERKGKGEA